LVISAIAPPDENTGASGSRKNYGITINSVPTATDVANSTTATINLNSNSIVFTIYT
jgi:hypothetical protein